MASDIDMSNNTPSRTVLHRAFPALRLAPATTTSADFSLPLWSAFGFAAALQSSRKARSPQVRARDPSPHNRRIYVAWPLATSASQSLACSPWPAPPKMQFVYLGSRFTLHASSPRSVALTQLRFTCLTVASSAGDLHPEDRAHAGRTSTAMPVGMARIRNDGSAHCQLQSEGPGRVSVPSVVAGSLWGAIPRRRLGWHRNSPRHRPVPKPDRLLASATNCR